MRLFIHRRIYSYFTRHLTLVSFLKLLICFGGRLFAAQMQRSVAAFSLFIGSGCFAAATLELQDHLQTKQTPQEKLERANFCLSRVNLQIVNKLFPSELSGGMKKRVAIARAISMNPRYLFCDEPNSGLDPQTAHLIDELIKEITIEYNMTTVVVTHDMNSVLEIGEKIYFLYQGKLWWEGTKHNILHTENAELQAFVFTSELTKRLRPVKEVGG